MKKFRRVLLAAVFAVILALGAVCITACGGKNDGGNNNTKQRYTLTFMFGTVLWDTVSEEAGAAYTLTKGDPTRTNYVFDGWSQTPNGDVEELPDKMPSGNRTYYAIFSARFNLSFNAGIGTIPDDNKTMIVKEGDDLYGLVKDVTPTVEGGDATFKGWYLRGTTEITATSGQKMPKGNAEVVAKYSVGYKINIYLENRFESGDYAEEPDDVVNCSAFVGDKVTGLPSYPGYYYDESKDNDVLYANLNKNSAQNAFELYYKLVGYDTIFNANLPSDVTYTGAMDGMTCGHGEEYTAPECQFEADGYRFYGWSTTPDGEVEYLAGEQFSVERSTTMYAQWVKGMTELAGRSSDRVYLINKRVGNELRLIPYLERTGLDDIAGDYDKTTHVFTFKNENATDPDEVLLRGIADSAHNTFTYLNTVNSTVYKLQKIDGTEDASVTLKLNDNGTAVYTNDTEDAVTGAYVGANDGSMLFTVDGQTRFAFRLVHSANGFVNFMIRGEEYGTWNNITQAGNVDLKYTLELDGYGYATMYVSTTSILTDRTTTPFNGRYAYTTGEGAYTGDDGIEVMVRLYNSSLQVRQFACLLLDGAYSTISADDTTVYTNVYLQRFETTLYGAPAGDGELDTETADKIELAGYSVVADSATYTYTNGDGEHVEVKGKYSYDSTAGTLRIKPTDGGADLLFEVSMHGEGENRVPVFEPVEELFGRYEVRGLDSVYGPNLLYTMSIYNNNRAVFSFLIPMYDDTFYGNIVDDYTPMVFGEYTVAVEGKTETGGADPRANVYEFSAEISPSIAAYIYNLYGSIYKYPLYLSTFGSFRFQFVYSATNGNIIGVNVTTRGDFQGGNEITYNGVKYTLDGFGTAVGEDESKLSYSYGTAGGIPIITLVVDDTKPTVETVMFMDWERNGSYAQHTGDYGAFNSDTYFRMIVFNDNSAVLTLGSTSTSLDPFSFGHVTWDDEEHTGGKYVRDGSVEFSDIYVGVNKTIYTFKFIIGKVKNRYGQWVEVIIIYDVNANVNANNEIVIETEDGKLTLSPAAADDDGVATAAAIYVEKGKNGRPDTEYKGAFSYVSDDIVQLIYSVETTSGSSSRKIVFRLEYDEENEIVGFHKLIDGAGGYFMDADDGKSYLYLSSEKNEDNKYVGVYYEYDEENETFIEHEGIYGFTSIQDALLDQNYGYGQDFTYETGETDDEGNAVTQTITFVTATNQAGVQYFLRYTPKYNNIYVFYMSASIGRPAAIGMLSGGGYSALVFTLYPNTVYQTQYQGVIEWNEDYSVNVFTATTGATFYLRFIQGLGLFLLDNTYVAEAKGMFTLSVPVDVDVPATEAQDATDDTPAVPAVSAHTAHVTKIEMSGMAFAYLHYDYVTEDGETEDRIISGIYVQYATNGFAFLMIGEDSTETLFRFRLNALTDEESGEVTYVAELADMDYYGTFVGDDLTVINLNGFDYAYYVDSYGRVYGGQFTVLESDETTALIEIMYIDTTEYVVKYAYARLDFENRTFVAAEAPTESD